MQDLVDEAHRIEVAGPGGARRIDGDLGGALFVHLLGEAARGGEVRKNDIAGQAEQPFVKVVALPGRTGYVELHPSA